jgi:hypothetical protein
MRKILGRRGGALLLSGILWLFVAWAVATMPLPTARPLAPHEYLPLEWRIIGWITSGTVAVVSAFLWRTVFLDGAATRLDRIGFAILMVMPAERALSWLSVLVWQLKFIPEPIPLPSMGSALSGFAVWMIVCIHLWLINGWAEPDLRVEVVAVDAGS